MLFQVPYIITEIILDEKRNVAQLRITSSTNIRKREVEKAVYVDEVVQLNGIIELPASIVYAGNSAHRVLKQEYKAALSEKSLITFLPDLPKVLHSESDVKPSTSSL